MATAALSSPFSGYRAAAQRIALALAISAFAHLLLVQSLVFDVLQQAAHPARAVTITVLLEPPAGTGPGRPVAAVPEPPRVARRTVAEGVGRGVARADTGGQLKQDAAAPPALPQAQDPTYYSARDLDFLPRPVVPLDLDRLVRDAVDGAAARFRLVLLIDEGGVVNEIAFIEAEPPDRLREELRALLASARFFPGQRDGHAVKSRVTLSVNFDPPRREPAAGR